MTTKRLESEGNRKMTKEEVIAFFKDMNECTYGNLEAVEKAIEALEQTSCDDAISRQAVLDAFWKLKIELRPNAIDAILNMVNGIPPVTPKSNTGHWIECKDRYDIWSKCSECEKEYDKHYIGHIRYCPNCGAKMEEEE